MPTIILLAQIGSAAFLGVIVAYVVGVYVRKYNYPDNVTTSRANDDVAKPEPKLTDGDQSKRIEEDQSKRLLEVMPQTWIDPKDKKKTKFITDDLVTYFHSTKGFYYISLHAKEFELGKDSQENITDIESINIFANQLYHLQKWMEEYAHSSIVVLMTDMNTECTVNGSTVTYTNKDRKPGCCVQTFNKHFVVKSAPQYSTTNKMRFMTAQLPKVYKNARSTIDHVFLFIPLALAADLSPPETRQLTCEGGEIAYRRGEHPQESCYPSDHDAVLLRSAAHGTYATLNCFSSGPSFDGSRLALNTFEFVPEDFRATALSFRDEVLGALDKVFEAHPELLGQAVALGSQLDEKGYFRKTADVFTKPRCLIMDIHLHPAYMPRILFDEASQQLTAEPTAAALAAEEAMVANPETVLSEPGSRWLLWKSEFEALSGRPVEKQFMASSGRHLLNAWQGILTRAELRPVFEKWYESVSGRAADRSKHSSRDLVQHLLLREGVTVVALQELVPARGDVEAVQATFKPEDGYKVVLAPPREHVDTVGALVIRL